MTRDRRRRRTRFHEQITVRVPKETKARIEALADQLESDLAEVVRRVFEVGLPLVDSGQVDTAMAHRQATPETVRRWWEGLLPRERSKWGRKLRHIEGAAFRLEACRLAMEAE